MDRYWVNGAGTWDATTTTNWATTSGGAGGASAPTSTDNVIFDSLSNATLYTVTIGADAVCEDFTVAAPLTGAVTFSLAATARIDCYGSMTLPAANCTWTGVAGCLVTFRATTTGKTITTNGVTLTLTAVTFNGVGGAWTLGSAITYGTSQSITVINGTFDTGNFNITGAIFAVNAVGTQVINLGSSTLTFNGATPINFTQTAGLTFNAGTSQITLTASTAITFVGGGQTFYNVSFTGISAGVTAITGANTFNDLNQTSRSATGIRIVSLGADQTVSGTLTLGAANTSIRRIQVQSSVIGTQRTITLNGSLATLADCDFRDIATAGTVGTWTGTRLGNGLGNSGITFDAAKDVYWNLAAGGAWEATAWALSSGGAVDANNFPLAQDKAIIENTGLNTSATITIGTWWIGELDASTRSNAMTFSNSTATPIVYKNVTLSSAVTMTGTGVWSFVGQGTTQILDTNTATFTPPITINSATGTLQLAEDTTCSGTVTLTSGTLDLSSGNRTLTCNIFSSSNTNTRVIAFGTGNITVTGTGTVWNTATATSLSVTGTPIVNVTSTGSTAIAVSTGVLTEANSISYNFTGGTYALVILNTSAQTVRSLNFTGYAGTLGGFGTNVYIYGNLTLSAGMTLTSNTGRLNFAATSGTQQITTNGKTLDFLLAQDGIGGTTQLQDNLTMGSTRTFTLTNGSLDLDDNTLTTGLFSSNNSNTRSIAFGTGNITTTGSGTVWTTATSTNFSRTGTPTVNISNNSATTTGIQTAAMTEAQALNFNFTTGTYTLSESTNNAYMSVNFTGFAGTMGGTARTIFGNYTLSAGMTLTAGGNITTFAGTSGTQLITTNGKTMDFPLTFNGIGGTFAFQDALTQGSTRAFTITNGTVQLKDGATSTVGVFATSGTNQKFLQSTLAGTQATISQASGTVNASYLTIQDINATGGATWNSLTTNNNVDNGNNDGWDFGVVSPAVLNLVFNSVFKTIFRPVF